jgi:hypothetical protein
MRKYYDFIEIGTYDLEPIKFYLDRLPNKKNVTKVNAAISEYNGFIDIYHIEEYKII